MTQPTVAIIGRPNVGKSTLVNRILGRREAIVQELPGVTRDRVVYQADWIGRNFTLVDTGGLELETTDALAGKVAAAARAAAESADAIVFVIDATAELTAEDREVAELLRKMGKPVLIAANKADNAKSDALAYELAELGLGNAHPISALNGRRTGDFMDEIIAMLPPEDGDEAPRDAAVAIVGRPNVGKSSLFNCISGQETSIVFDAPGTTRDTVDAFISSGDQTYCFVDTAGLRRQVKIDDSTEYFGYVRTMRAIDRCDVAVLMVDGADGITRQDLRIADRLIESGRSTIIVQNKIDLLDDQLRIIESQEIRRRLPMLDHAPLIETSTVTGVGIAKILPLVTRLLVARKMRVPTPILNSVIDDLQGRTPIPSKRAGIRVKFAVQAQSDAPTFVLFGTGNDIPRNWLRYLEKGLRKKFGFEGAPIKFVTREGKGRA